MWFLSLRDVLCSLVQAPIPQRGSDKYKLWYKDTPINSHVAKHIESELDQFVPPFWAKYPYIQSFLGDTIGFVPKPTIYSSRSYVITDDNQVLVIDKLNQGCNKPKAFLLITHGISGTSECKYMLRWESICRENGFIGIMYNRRGHLFTLNEKATRFPSHSDPKDCEHVVQTIRKLYGQHKDVPIIGIGHSAGGPHLAQYVHYTTLFPSAPPLAGLVMISSANDFHASKVYFETNKVGMNINKFLFNLVHDIYMKNDKCISQKIDLDIFKHRRNQSITRLDFFTCTRLHKYNSINDYYTQVQPLNIMNTIACPTLHMVAEDDPFLCPETFYHMKEYSQSNPNIMCVITKHGGHMGWVNSKYKCIYYDVVVKWINQMVLRI